MPTIYFIGVTTGQSSIHRIFPHWVELAGVADAVLKGVDIPVGGAPEEYRQAVEAIRGDRDALGALVTTHKVCIWEHARDLFTEFDADAMQLHEVSCIVQRPGRLCGLAVDAVTSGIALREIIGERRFTGSVLILGAGGAALALAIELFREHRPREVILTDISEARLVEVKRLTPARPVQVARPEDHDRLIGSMPAGSLIVNATGIGKDRPGSPITPAAHFPHGSTAWDFNYRGDLRFLDEATAQGVRAEDGWEYFLRGWSQIMSRVLGFELTPELFSRMRESAESLR